MLKNLLLINTALRILFLSDTHPGRVHDKRIVDTTPYPLPAGSQLLQDLGFQAFTLASVTIMQPTEKPCGQELTRANKARNRKLARRRVRIEHADSSVKRYRMLQTLPHAQRDHPGMESGSSRYADGNRLCLAQLPCPLTPSWALMV